MIVVRMQGADDDRSPNEPKTTSPAMPEEVDLERLVWDPEYRRRISDLLKKPDPTREMDGARAGI